MLTGSRIYYKSTLSIIDGSGKKMCSFQILVWTPGLSFVFKIQSRFNKTGK